MAYKSLKNCCKLKLLKFCTSDLNLLVSMDIRILLYYVIEKQYDVYIQQSLHIIMILSLRSLKVTESLYRMTDIDYLCVYT